MWFCVAYSRADASIIGRTTSFIGVIQSETNVHCSPSHLERRREVGHAELRQPLLGDVEVFQAIAHLLPGERLLAVHLLGGADRFGHDHGVDEAAVVEHLADMLAVA